jgi:hypothetical protein
VVVKPGQDKSIAGIVTERGNKPPCVFILSLATGSVIQKHNHMLEDRLLLNSVVKKRY